MQDAEPQLTNAPQAAGDPIVKAEGLRKDYVGGREPVHALRGIDLSIRPGEFVAIMGASGSGKSTLLHMLGGLDQPSGGTVVIEGHDLARMNDRERTLFRRRRLGIIFQAYNLLPTLSAIENVTLPAMLDGSGERRTTELARDLLEQVDMGHRFTHRPQALSGGEQQRVAIARSLVNDPALLLADEPTGNLDTRHGQEIWQLLANLVRERKRTVVAVTHEADGAVHADRVIVLKDGRIAGEISPDGERDATALAARYHELVV